MRKEFLLTLIAGGLFCIPAASAINQNQLYKPGKTGMESFVNPFRQNMAKALQNETIQHRKMYGFFLGSANWGMEYGIGELFMDDLTANTLLYPFGELEALYAGAVADGIYYGAAYLYSYSGPPQAAQMIAIDLVTGKRKDLGEWTNSQMLRLQDMTYDINNKTMYACGYEMGESILFSVDLKNGAMTRICTMSKTAGTIAADKNGVLYIISQDGILCRVDKTDGSLTELHNFNMGGMALGQTMDFDHTSDKLYWSSCTGSSSDFSLIEITIDGDQVSITDLGFIGGKNSNSELKGLYIPYALGGVNVPEAPTGITITPAPNAELKATIRMKTPARTFGGSGLSDLQSVTILRDNEKIAEIPFTQIGADFEWVDEAVPTNKEYRYAIYATNGSGDGQLAYAAQYVGEDIPERVGGVKIQTTEGCAGVRIQWEKPVNGLNGGYFIESNISYEITRQPGNRVVARDLKECIYTDESINQLSAYYYEIKAYNSVGSSTYYTPYLIAGPALSIPFTETFDRPDNVQNVWTCIDNNFDAYTWNIATGLGSYQFGDNMPALEYFIDPYFTSYEITEDADEWVITPPVNLKQDKHYEFYIKARSMSPESIEVYFGKRNAIEALEYQGNFNMDGQDGICDFDEYSLELPVSDGAHCVSLRLTTPFPANRKSFLQIGEAGIRENVLNKVSETAENTCFITRSEEFIRISGSFDTAEMYSVNGAKVAATSESQINTANLTKGVYVLKVNNGEATHVFKVTVE